MAEQKLETIAVHGGDPIERFAGAIHVPIFQSTVYEQVDGGDYHSIIYPRLNNLENHTALARLLCALEKGEHAFVCASGMAAISTVLLTLLRPGDHVIVQNGLYGGTHNLFTHELKEFGITFDTIEVHQDQSAWEQLIKPSTKVLYVETITNPLLQVINHTDAVAFARKHNLISVIDNTFASPINFQPLTLGYDIVVHSATKFLCGHNDLNCGAVVGNKSLVEKCLQRLNHLGGCLDPHSCYLLQRGIKTLALRMKQHNASALEIATFLSEHKAVNRVYYPLLPTHASYATAKKFLSGGGGVVSFELKGGEMAARNMIDYVRIPMKGPSLGGVETLISRPAGASHLGMTPEERHAMGISDGLIRLSVGIEDAGDLISDLKQALDAVAAYEESLLPEEDEEPSTA